jgi:hypothetical protein
VMMTDTKFWPFNSALKIAPEFLGSVILKFLTTIELITRLFILLDTNKPNNFVFIPLHYAFINEKVGP